MPRKCRDAVYGNSDALFSFFCVPYFISDALGTTKKEKEKGRFSYRSKSSSLQYPTSANSSMNHVPTPSPGPRTHRYPLYHALHNAARYSYRIPLGFGELIGINIHGI